MLIAGKRWDSNLHVNRHTFTQLAAEDAAPNLAMVLKSVRRFVSCDQKTAIRESMHKNFSFIEILVTTLDLLNVELHNANQAWKHVLGLSMVFLSFMRLLITKQSDQRAFYFPAFTLRGSWTKSSWSLYVQCLMISVGWKPLAMT